MYLLLRYSFAGSCMYVTGNLHGPWPYFCIIEPEYIVKSMCTFYLQISGKKAKPSLYSEGKYTKHQKFRVRQFILYVLKPVIFLYF